MAGPVNSEQSQRWYRIETQRPIIMSLLLVWEEVKTGRGRWVWNRDAVSCSEQTVKSANYNTPYLSYINDYGGRPVLSFICNGSRCLWKKRNNVPAITVKCGWILWLWIKQQQYSYLIALSLSGFIHTFLRAERAGIYDDVFTADELHHYRINERGRTWKLGSQWCTAVPTLHAGE